MTKVVKEIITKPDQQAIVGLSIGDKTLANKTTVPVITKLAAEDGLVSAETTELQIGMRVLTINGIACRGRDDTFAMLRMGVGEMTIVAGPVTMVAATVTKATADTKVGFSMMMNDDNKIVVSKVAPGGLFAKTNLKVGMSIHSINDSDVSGLSLDEVMAIFGAAKGSVTVLAEEVPPKKSTTAKPATTTTTTTAPTVKSSVTSNNNGSQRSLGGSQRSLGDSLRNLGAEFKAAKRRSSLKKMDVPQNATVTKKLNEGILSI